MYRGEEANQMDGGVSQTTSSSYEEQTVLGPALIRPPIPIAWELVRLMNEKNSLVLAGLPMVE